MEPVGPVQRTQFAFKVNVEMPKHAHRTVKGKPVAQTAAVESVVNVMDSVMLEYA